MTNQTMPSCGPRVVIIGAGVAGISAASRLIENGFVNFVILEAEDRVGGRICTKSLGDEVVDLGAQYCRKDSIVYHLVKDFDLLEARNVSTHVYHSQNGRLEDSFVNKLLNKVSALYHRGGVQNVEWKKYLEERFDDEIVNLFNNERELLLARDNFDFVKKQVLLYTGSVCLNGVYGATSGEFPPDFRFIWKSHGYQALLDILMKKYLKNESAFQFENKVILNSEVSTIEWGEEDGAKVICANGLHYLADYVIVTVPLGALKRQHSALFSPALPMTKQKAIELLGFGSILKVCFYFSTKWWSDNDIAFAWGEEDLKSALKKSEHPWMTNCMGFYLVPNNPNVLMAWFVGNYIPTLESINDDVLLDGAHKVLQRFLGSTFENITKPIKLERNRWCTNPHFGGVISYETLDSKRHGLNGETLAESVVSKVGTPQLLFAGEATTKVGYGSVNGAVISGFREADRIIDYCRGN